MFDQVSQSNSPQLYSQPWEDAPGNDLSGNNVVSTDAGADPELDLGELLLNNYPEGIPAIVYLVNDKNEFKPESLLWAKQHKAVGILDKTIALDQVGVGLAIPHEMTEGTGNNARFIRMDEIIPKFGAILQAAVDKAETERAKNDAAYVKNPLAPKIKTLALSSHGTCYGWGGNMDTQDVPTFIPAISSYLTNDVNVIMYACGTGTNPGEDYSWFNKTEGGEQSIAGQVRDQLAATGHTEGRAWGHLVSGHFLDVWPQRFFDAATPGQAGTNYFNYVFGSEIAAYSAEVINELRKLDYLLTDPVQIEDASTKAAAKVESNYYAAYQNAMNTKSYGNPVKGTSDLGEMAPVDPDGVAAIIRENYNTNYKSKSPLASATAVSIAPVVKPKLTKVAGVGNADVKTMTETMKTNILALPQPEKDKIPDIVTHFTTLTEANYPVAVDTAFQSLLTEYEQGMNTAKGQTIYPQPGVINPAILQELGGIK